MVNLSQVVLSLSMRIDLSFAEKEMMKNKKQANLV